MNEKNLMKIDSAEENAELESEDIEDIVENDESANKNAEDMLENAETTYEDAEDTPESAELFAEDAEDTNLAIEDEGAPAENAEGYDLEELKKSFPELAELKSVGELLYPEKYEKFRSLGLSPAEAFLATGQALKPKKAAPSSPISVARQRDGIPNRELKFAREIFTDLCDKEIQELYKKVSK